MAIQSKYLQMIPGLSLSILLLISALWGMQQHTQTEIPEGLSEGSTLQYGFIDSHIPHDTISITSNDNFTQLGFPGNGTLESPYIISGYNITSTYMNCIRIQDTDTHFIVEDCIVFGDGSTWGIALWNVTNGVVRNNTIIDHDVGAFIRSTSNNIMFVNNTISETTQSGVIIYSSSNISVTNNTMIGNYADGINILEATFCEMINNKISDNNLIAVDIIYASNITVIRNNISRNPFGIHLSSSSNCTFINNTVDECSSYGIKLLCSSHNTFETNTVTGNKNDGIRIDASSFNVIRRNEVTENRYYGLNIESTSSECNLIYLNIFSNRGHTNAYDFGSKTQWNRTGMGNYWSDYNGIGTYNILGIGNSIDYHPFIYPPDYIVPTINQVSDIVYVEGTSEHNITWIPNDEYPSHYVVYRNDTEIESVSWNGSSIIVNIIGLDIGDYNYTIVVYDTSGNCVRDIVIVTVISQNPTNTITNTVSTNLNENNLDISLPSMIIIGVAIVLSVIIVKKRKN